MSGSHLCYQGTEQVPNKVYLSVFDKEERRAVKWKVQINSAQLHIRGWFSHRPLISAVGPDLIS